MNSFYYIIQKILNNKSVIYDFTENYQTNMEIIFNDELDKYEKERPLVKVLFSIYIHRFKPSAHIKNIQFIWNLLNNVFNNPNIKNELIPKFNKIQRVYFAFSKLAYIYKFKKAKCQITTDLYFNTININDPNVIQIYQNNMTYLFTINDLIHLLNVALTNSSHFFVKPLECKNPYNNMPFSNQILYNIYFFIKQTQTEIPELIHQFFIEEFDLTCFLHNNQQLIQTISIKEYVSNLSTIKLYEYGIHIFNKFNKFFHPEIIIHSDFPKKKVADVMKPFIVLYFLSNYSSNYFNKTHATKELHLKMTLFYKYNPFFGRKYIKIINNELNQPIKKVYFNDSSYVV